MTNHYTLEMPLQVWVFKTDLRFKKDVQKVQPLLTDHPRIIRWNVARDDSDKVLRIESQWIQPEEVISLLREAGYQCEELND